MYSSKLTGLVATLIATASAIPSVPIEFATRNATQPCALIASEVRSGLNRHDPKVGYACLQSVPFELTAALKTIESARRISEFQSDLEYLADPPEGYLGPAVDILGSLDDIEQKAKQGGYSNEWDFERELAELFAKAGDFHFNFEGALYGFVMNFARPKQLKLISASKDGTSTPKIYLYDDALKADPPEITKINGQDATSFLQEESKGVNWNNPHARYNLMFFQTAYNDRLMPEAWLEPQFYPGPNTAITFSNGTSRSYPNYAWTAAPLARGWLNVNDGNDVYNTFVNPRSRYAIGKRDTDFLNDLEARGSLDYEDLDVDAALQDAPSNIPAKFRIDPDERPEVPVYYPRPTMEFNLGFPHIAGYFIDTDGESNVAVLMLPTFADDSGKADDKKYVFGFLQFMQEFLQECKARNSPRLIIDVRGNGGGIVALGLNLFAQLFPGTEYYQGTRIRISETTTSVMKQLAQLAINQLPSSLAAVFIATDPFDYRSGFDENLKLFSNPADKIGDNEDNGEQVSNIVRPGPQQLFRQFIDSGAAFQEDDVLILSDGACGSTCARFVEMMTNDVRVKTLAVGGTPQEGPMAFAGGSKGAQVLELSKFFEPLARLVAKIIANFSSVQAARDALRTYLPTPPGIATSSARANVLDQIRSADEETPTQFIVDNADCRIWYTPEMYAKPEALWQAAYTTTWGDGGSDACVGDSTGHTNAQGSGSSDGGDDDSASIQITASWMKTLAMAGLTVMGIVFVW